MSETLQMIDPVKEQADNNEEEVKQLKKRLDLACEILMRMLHTVSMLSSWLQQDPKILHMISALDNGRRADR